MNALIIFSLSSDRRRLAIARTIVHFELPSGDADRASGFWGGLFGWQIGAWADENAA
jgi:predicted enzyme related to lactoylglutathione lyase